MQIDTIHYSRKASDGQYGNAELGMHAQLDVDDDPIQCAQYLQTLVTGTLDEHARLAERRDEGDREEYELNYRLNHKREELERMEKQWNLAREFLEYHKVDVSRYTDVPF